MVPKVTVLRDVTPHSLVGMYQDFRGPSWPLFPYCCSTDVTLTKWFLKSHTSYSALLPISLVPACPQPHCTYIQTVLLPHSLFVCPDKRWSRIFWNTGTLCVSTSPQMTIPQNTVIFTAIAMRIPNLTLHGTCEKELPHIPQKSITYVHLVMST